MKWAVGSETSVGVVWIVSFGSKEGGREISKQTIQWGRFMDAKKIELFINPEMHDQESCNLEFLDFLKIQNIDLLMRTR